MRSTVWPSLLLLACGPSSTVVEPPPPTPTPPPLSSFCGDTAAFAAAAGEGKPREEIARLFIAQCGLEETIALTSDLIRFATVSEKESAADGPSFAAMAAYLKGWAERSGMRFEAYGKNDAWEIQLGEGAPLVSFVMHADVVPAEASEWKTPPFEPKVDGALLYGRGSEDDKGPIAAVLVTMHALARFQVPLAGRITAIMGTGEEHDWDGMIAYAKERPHAKYVISLDSSYPVVVAESGFVAWKIGVPKKGGAKKKGCAEITAADIGQFLTVVPGEAKMTIAGSRSSLDAAIEKVKSDQFTFEVKENGKRFDVTAKGEAIHSSEADKGRNAFWALARLASSLELCPGGAATMMRLVAKKFDGDHWGEKLGLTYEHPLMGRLLVTPTMLRTEKDRVVLSVNMRRPAGKTAKEFEAELDRAAARLKKEISRDLVQLTDQRFVGEPALADTTGPLVDTLLAIYEQETGEENPQPIAIRGGTYARLFNGAVSFGPSLPGKPYRGHAPDEYVELDALGLMNRTTLDAMLKLAATATTAK